MGLKKLAAKLSYWLDPNDIQRVAEQEIYQEIAYQRAREAAADKILRRAGEKP